MYFENYDLTNVKTPVDVDQLVKLLTVAKYPQDKIDKLHRGFSQGFDIGYRGNKNVKMKSPNLKLTIGSPIELWNKVIKEVQLGRYAGPYQTVPFEHYIQSPIGLVPKDKGQKTRLIFHLSYPKNSGKSLNENTPETLKKVNYVDFDQAVRLCLKTGVSASMGKSDLISAFRHLGIRPEDWCWLVMKARSPIDGRTYYFVDKCLPFGAAVSCALFQAFSDALAWIVSYKTSQENINYLDDFFFVALFKAACDLQIRCFLEVCDKIKFPVSMEKTFWGRTIITLPWTPHRFRQSDGECSN